MQIEMKIIHENSHATAINISKETEVNDFLKEVQI